MLRVLVACEESQVVCSAFRRLGCEAYSCDIIECSGGHPEWHIMQDVLPLIDGRCSFTTMDGVTHFIDGKWDILIAHPPCTYLSNAGACRLYPKKGVLDQERYNKGLEGKEFFMRFLNADCDHICVENPIPSKIFGLPQYSQIIQPYEYGHPYTKRTCLWLKGLPCLVPTDIVVPVGPYVCGNGDNWKRQAENGIVYGKEKSAKHRSKTFYGVGDAMAKQFVEALNG